ncbi:uncharacterized protein LOC110737536 [Chenopodium quinoa]|uniref:uncharacterized protein LOC110737536 n=1 Tax=Chenopodium quinoa TaxID=63459 RepID=UPI000B77C6E4|nr:uncharacterized protein LOC110737536 [Chenopodium quinoa]
MIVRIKLLIILVELQAAMSFIRSSPSKQRKCDCGIPMARLTSWTRENPGRKFKACKFYDPKTESRGCKCFEWVDEEEGTEWQRDVINQLLLDKKLMKGEMNSLQRELEDLSGQRRCLLTENDNLIVKCKALSSEMKKYNKEGQNSGVGGMLCVIASVMCCVFVIVGVLIVMK